MVNNMSEKLTKCFDCMNQVSANDMHNVYCNRVSRLVEHFKEHGYGVCHVGEYKMENEKSKKLITCFERLNKTVNFFIRHDLTLITYYPAQDDALLFVFISTDGRYEYTVRVELNDDFTDISDERFVHWLEETYDKLLTQGEFDEL